MNENCADLYTRAANCENLPFVGAAVSLRKWAHYARAFISNFTVRGVWFITWLLMRLSSLSAVSVRSSDQSLLLLLELNKVL